MIITSTILNIPQENIKPTFERIFSYEKSHNIENIFLDEKFEELISSISEQ